MEQPTPTVTPPAVPATAKRKSRRAWYVVGFLLSILMVPVSWYFIGEWLGERELEALCVELDAEDPDWRWPDLIAKIQPIPGEENSAEQILKVGTLANKGTAFEVGPKWKRTNFASNTRLTHDQAEAGRIAFSGSDPALRNEARKLKDLPGGRFAISNDGNIFTMDSSDLLRSRDACRVLQIDALMRAHEGDMDGAAESCQAMLNTTGALHRHPTVIGYLVRCAEQVMAIGTLEQALGQGSVAESQLQRLQDLLQREADTDGLLDALRGERAGTHQTFMNIRDGKLSMSILFRDGKYPPDPPGYSDRLLDAFPGMVLKQYPDYLRYMTEYMRACKSDTPDRDAKVMELEQQTRTRSNTVMRRMMPGVSKIAQTSTRSQAMLRCATVAIAAERYRVKHGVWPAAAPDLVKDRLLAGLPNDPYDGKPLRWKRTPNGILIYSVGVDKVDNGGTLNRAKMTADGADLGFELFDPTLRGVPAPVGD